MANFHYGLVQYQQPPLPSHAASHSHGHHGRNRRGPRVASQNANRQFKAQRSPKDAPEAPAYSDYLRSLEAAKSFEFDDDEIFCPFNLLTEDDLHSIHSSSASERSSLSSGSPDSSPLQQQVQPTPSLLLSSVPNNYHTGFQPAQQQQHHHHHHQTHHHSHHQPHAQHMKLHQPLAQRSRNAIPIVDPSTRSVASPPMSVSPARQMPPQYIARRW